MKKICLVTIALAVVVCLQAQNDVIRAPRPKVGVVMGGGGAKGAAHIGVLKYIEEMGIPVDYVAGTSMGSIMGGLYALGYTPDQLKQLISNMDWSQYIGNKIDRATMSEEARRRNSTFLLNVPFSFGSLSDDNSNSTFISQLPSAYVNNSSLVNLFNDLCVGYQEQMDFNDLPIPFACVATDLITGDEVVLRSGIVPTAMRASMAIPGVFSPVQIGDRVLVDGGLVNNFPADVLRAMGADIIIGIEITSSKDVTADDLQSLPQVFGRLVTNSTSFKREENRKLCNIYIVPDISGFGMLSFTSEAIDTLVERGYKKAVEFHDQLLSIKQALDQAAGYSVGKILLADQAKNIAIDTVMIRSVTINNVTEAQSRWLIRKGGLKVGQLHTQESIDHAMQIYRGTGCFDEITYNVKESDSLHREKMLEGVYDLNVHMKPAKPHVFGLGVRYDTEEGAGVLLNLGLNAKRFGGSKLDFSAKLSYNPRLNLTYTYSKSSLANFSVAADYRNEHFKMLTDNKNGVNLHYQQKKVSAYVSQFHLLNFGTAVGISYARNSFDRSSIEGSFFDTVFFVTNTLLSPYVTISYDNLEDAYFAKHGIVARLTSHYHIDTHTKGKSFDISYAFQGYITPKNGRVTIIPQLYGRYVTFSDYFNMWNLIGGEIAGRHFEEQMPFIGITSVNSTYDNATILRCDLRYNFYGKHYLTAMYNYMVPLNLAPYGVLHMFKNGTQGAGLRYAYKSLLGPISLTAHWMRDGNLNHFGAYFSFGYTF